MTRAQIEMLIADRVYEGEKAAAAMLGHDGMESAVLCLGAFCGVLMLACEVERPAVLTRFRPAGAV